MSLPSWALTSSWVMRPRVPLPRTWLISTPISRARRRTVGEAAAALPGEAARHANAAMLAGADDPRAPNVLAGLEGKQATPRSSAWVCSACHLAEPAWTPACVHCHALGSLVWKA